MKIKYDILKNSIKKIIREKQISNKRIIIKVDIKIKLNQILNDEIKRKYSKQNIYQLKDRRSNLI
jgi:hypothetical protein